MADPPGDPSAVQTYADGAGTRLLVRFDGFVHNAGRGPFEIQGEGRAGSTMTSVRQRVVDGSGSVFESVTASVLFETDDSHDHWHLKNIARYSLWNLAGTAEVAPAQKVGFCLIDSQSVEPHAAPRAYTTRSDGWCQQGNPSAASVTMGVSAGWRDVYGSQVAFQWVDVSNVPPGWYRVRSDIDPDGSIRESNEVNPPAWAAREALVPGYLAENVSQPAAPGPRQVQLAATSFGSVTGAPQYKIVGGPQHGTLDKPVGQWFDGADVQYTPAGGHTGPDSFTFAARDPSSGFPRNPPAAVATLEGPGTPIVTIAGAPASLQTGASAQLSAVVQNGPPEVSWTVDGVPGGGARVGTISPGGLYRAPDAVPAAGQVRVGAKGASGGSGEAIIKIVAPARRQAPGVPGAVPRSRRKSNPLSPLRLARHGDRLLVSLVSSKAGRVVVRARKGGRRIGRCAARVSRGRRMTCAIKLDRRTARATLFCRVPRASRLRLPGVHVSATLYVKGRPKAVRRARLRD